MNTNEILELVRAGYTKDEITAMGADPEKKEPEKKEPEKTQPEKKEPEKKEPEKTQPDNSGDLLKLLVEKFDDLKTAIQDNNIKNSNNKMVSDTPPEELLAEIIEPPKRK